MKKQVISLTLNAVMFITPLFAMDQGLPEDIPPSLSLFSRKNQEYKVSREQFKNFMERPCQTTWWVNRYDKENYPIKTYSFSIGQNQYELHVRHLEDALKNFENGWKTFYPTKRKIYSSFEPEIFSEEHVFKDKPGDAAYGKVYVRRIN